MSKILIVDDNEAASKSLSLLLEKEGYECQTAKEGGEAMAITACWRPDLVILDLLMAPINGWEYLDSKYAQEDLRNIPVVVMSAWSQIPQPLTPCAITILQKPIEPPEVLEVVRNILRGPT